MSYDKVLKEISEMISQYGIKNTIRAVAPESEIPRLIDSSRCSGVVPVVPDLVHFKLESDYVDMVSYGMDCYRDDLIDF